MFHGSNPIISWKKLYKLKAIKIFIYIIIYISINHNFSSFKDHCYSRLGACKPTNGVENILRHMSAESVRKRVDCAVGIGRCDSIGKKLKEEGPKALQAAKCGNK